MDINELIEYIMTPVAQVGLIIGIAEVIKRMNWFDSKYIPLVDLALGLICGVGIYIISLGYNIAEGIMIGLAIGLSACGLFSGIKNVTGGYDHYYEDIDKEEDV